MVTRTEIITTLAAIERTLDNRVEVWRTVVDAQGNIVRRIYRGSFTVNKH